MLERFKNEMQINGRSDKTISSYMETLKNAEKYGDLIGKPLDTWNKEDITSYILDIQKVYSPSSVELKKTHIKHFFKWMGKEEMTDHIKIKTIKCNLKREDILTVEDVNRLIEGTDSHLYKALIAFMFESGARIGEILAIRVKDVQENDMGMIVGIPQTKTGNDIRRVGCPFSSQYIRNMLSYLPVSKDSKLFDISKEGVWIYLKKLADKVGIDKPISAHKFRHAQATYMVLNGYQESNIRKKLGWTGDSEMIARYIHMVDDDVINAAFEKSGGICTPKKILELNQPESLKIADSQLTISRLIEENRRLAEKLALLEDESGNRMDKLEKALIGFRLLPK